ncbi:MAG: hypothetical protein FJY07_11035 [Bacteroidetes bacterium]|nr:hypothetical protein [Bacteroidota bacterium]
MITKEILYQTINGLPDHFTFDELIDRILLLHKIEIGLEQSEAGKTLTDEQAREKLEKWLK